MLKAKISKSLGGLGHCWERLRGNRSLKCTDKLVLKSGLPDCVSQEVFAKKYSFSLTFPNCQCSMRVLGMVYCLKHRIPPFILYRAMFLCPSSNNQI